jgi:hypothetical protein
MKGKYAEKNIFDGEKPWFRFRCSLKTNPLTITKRKPKFGLWIFFHINIAECYRCKQSQNPMIRY